MSVRLYDLGVENTEHKREKVKAVAWPIAAWRCFIPDSLVPEINIIEKMVLMMVSRGIVETKGDINSILRDQLGMNSELTKNVIASCIEKYMDKRHTKLVLNSDTQKKLEFLEDGDPFKSAQSDSMKAVYMFQDLISQTVIPCFNIVELPKDYTQAEDGEFIYIGDSSLSGYPSNQPRTAIINNAIRQWGKISRYIQEGDSNEIARLNVSDEIVESDILDKEDSEIEVIEQFPIYESNAEIKTMRTDDSIKRKEVAQIAIYDDSPEKLWAKGYFVFDSDYPEEVEIISPFGPTYDMWFKKVVVRRLMVDEEFKLKLQLFKEDTFEHLKGKVAIKNSLNIELFNKYPLICNDTKKYGLLKNSIEDFSKSFLKLKEGENEGKHFAGDLRTALDVLLKCAVRANSYLREVDEILGKGSSYPKPSNHNERKNTKDHRYNNYMTRLLKASKQFNIDRETCRKYSGFKIFCNLDNDFDERLSSIEQSANTKDLLAMMLIYASDYPNSKIGLFINDFVTYLSVAYDMANLGSSAVHSGESNVTIQKATEYYNQFGMIVEIVYSHLMEEY